MRDRMNSVLNEPKKIVLFYMLVLVVAGLLWPSEIGIGEGMLRVLRTPGVLLTDYMQVAGPGVALFNAGVVGLMGLALVLVAGGDIAGGSIAGVFTMAGFALFGKNPLNILPIILGVYLFSRVREQSFKSYLIVAMFGTALAPLVSLMVVGLDISPLWGILTGVVTGFVLPALAPHLLHNHQGYNLYNVGFTAGIVGTIALALLKSFGQGASPVLLWSTEYSHPLLFCGLVYFGSMVMLGLRLGATTSELKSLMSLPGGLITDFPMQVGFPATYVNMGMVGILGLSYSFVVGGVLNGPTMGGVLTMVGFAAFGKHVRNVTPIMAGVALGALFKVVSINSPGAILAALFGTALGPLAGGFGPLIGMISGFLHLSVVSHVGVMHGGINLYNNGLAAGFVATLVVALARTFNLKSR